jgi:hypothetical protein
MGHNRLRYCLRSCDVTEEFPLEFVGNHINGHVQR